MSAQRARSDPPTTVPRSRRHPDQAPVSTPEQAQRPASCHEQHPGRKAKTAGDRAPPPPPAPRQCYPQPRPRQPKTATATSSRYPPAPTPTSHDPPVAAARTDPTEQLMHEPHHEGPEPRSFPKHDRPPTSPRDQSTARAPPPRAKRQQLRSNTCGPRRTVADELAADAKPSGHARRRSAPTRSVTSSNPGRSPGTNADRRSPMALHKRRAADVALPRVDEYERCCRAHPDRRIRMALQSSRHPGTTPTWSETVAAARQRLIVLAQRRKLRARANSGAPSAPRT